MKIKRILVSQPEPKTEKSPYFDLAKRMNVKVDFHPFIHVEGVSVKEFRKSRIDIEAHTAVVFTSRTAIDHFFRICQELRIEVSSDMKYFCISEATAFYLQKYIVYRKRKITYGNGRFADLVSKMKKYKDEKFLVPLSDSHKKEIPNLLEKEGYNFTKAILYRTVSSDLSDLKDVNYDLLVFFSPSGIKSLFNNFPNYQQNSTKIAGFGPTTAKAIAEAGLKLDIKAPTPEAPSMIMAIEQFIKEQKKK